jgi:AcrR family transcriptional regulator
MSGMRRAWPGSGSSPRPAVAESGVLRAVILEAGERALSQYGYFGLSLRQLAREIGVHPQTIRYHFHDKRGLLRAIEGRVSERDSQDRVA